MKLTRILAASALTLLGGRGIQAQIVANGTFDGDPASPWSLVGGQGFSGYTGTAYLFGQGFQADPDGGVAQLLATDIGATYSFSFDAVNGTPGDGYLSVIFGGQTIFDQVLTNGAWQTFSTSSVVATGSSSLLEFYGDGPQSYQAIDNVVGHEVSATPEPSSLVLMGSGLMGLLGVAARRRRSC